jgi:hypothetical protein
MLSSKITTVNASGEIRGPKYAVPNLNDFGSKALHLEKEQLL